MTNTLKSPRQIGVFSFNSKMATGTGHHGADGHANGSDEDETEDEKETNETEDLKSTSLNQTRNYLIPREPASYQKQRESEEMNETDVYPIRISLTPG
jgi:hypothetical protein